ncbi:MAG: acyl-CoA dehydrogenase family protein [Carbonactinosporaceae bacterium]
MYFALTDEQRALQETARRFLAERFPLSAVRELYDDPAGDGDPPKLWKAIGEQGWLAVLVPEEHDGLGRGLLDAAVIARCWGAGCGPGPWLPTLVTAEALRLAGDPGQLAAWLPRVAAGEAKLAPALGHGDVTKVTVREGRLSGAATHVEYAHVADRLVVAASPAGTAGGEGDGTGLWLVDPRGEGVRVTRHDALDRSARLATVTFDGTPAERLPGGSDAVRSGVLDRAAVLYANDLVGVARTALARTVAYDIQREQFGRPVGSFQAVKHALADLHVGVTMAEHGALYAAHAVDEALPDARLAVSIAKAKASDVARDATAAAIQYHGGIGYTWEHDAHLFFKRAKREEYAYGDAVTHRERIARLVVDAARP